MKLIQEKKHDYQLNNTRAKVIKYLVSINTYIIYEIICPIGIVP